MDKQKVRMDGLDPEKVLEKTVERVRDRFQEYVDGLVERVCDTCEIECNGHHGHQIIRVGIDKEMEVDELMMILNEESVI